MPRRTRDSNPTLLPSYLEANYATVPSPPCSAWCLPSPLHNCLGLPLAFYVTTTPVCLVPSSPAESWAVQGGRMGEMLS